MIKSVLESIALYQDNKIYLESQENQELKMLHNNNTVCRYKWIINVMLVCFDPAVAHTKQN